MTAPNVSHRKIITRLTDTVKQLHRPSSSRIYKILYTNTLAIVVADISRARKQRNRICRAIKLDKSM